MIMTEREEEEKKGRGNLFIGGIDEVKSCNYDYRKRVGGRDRRRVNSFDVLRTFLNKI